MSRLSPANPQCPRCKTKQKKTIIDQCLLKCALPLQFVCSWVTSLVLIICVTLLERMLGNHRLCSSEKKFLYIHHMVKNVLQYILFYVLYKRKKVIQVWGATRDMKMTEYIFLEIIKQTKMFLMKPERGFCPSI